MLIFGFKRTLILLLTLLTIGSITLVSIVSISSIRGKVYEITEQEVEGQLNYQALGIENLISVNKRAIDDIGKTYDSLLGTGRFSNMNKWFLNYSEPYIRLFNFSNISFVTDDGTAFDRVMFSEEGGVYYLEEGAYDYRNAEWYVHSDMNSGVVTNAPYKKKNDDNLYISVSRKSKGGVINGEISIDEFSSLALSTTNKEIESLLIHSNGVVISSSDSSIQGQSLKNIDSTLYRDIIAGKTQFSTLDDADQNYHWFVKEMPFSNTDSLYLILSIKNNELNKIVNLIEKDLIYSGASSVVFSILVLLTLLHFAFKPIEQLKQRVINLNSGQADLTQRINIETNDELGVIAKHLNGFIENLQNIVTEMCDASSVMKNNVQTLFVQLERNSTLIDEHTETTTSVSSIVDNMKKINDQVDQNVTNALGFSKSASDSALESGVSAEKVIVNISELQKDVNNTSVSVAEVNELINEISDVLNLINEVAEQTNLLSLNAAIEAARAGEQGRGFAVVADEVRTLAFKTKKSTESISDVLDNIRNKSGNVLSNINKTSSECNHMAETTEMALNKFHKVNQIVYKIDGVTDEISLASARQSEHTKTLKSNLIAIQDAVVNITKNNGKTQDGVSEIAAAYTQLERLVNKFKI